MKTQKPIRYLTFALSFFLIVAGPLSIQAAPQTQAASGANPVTEQTSLEQHATVDDPSAVFTYQVEGRPDPFAPFISEKAVSTGNNDEIVENNEPLSGMQLFEPGQLKLVAIVFEKNAEMAMVEDATGQGYTIRPGMKIGKKGIITSITPNQVIIEETSVTRSGKKLTKTIVMLLKKKGAE